VCACESDECVIELVRECVHVLVRRCVHEVSERCVHKVSEGCVHLWLRTVCLRECGSPCMTQVRGCVHE